MIQELDLVPENKRKPERESICNAPCVMISAYFHQPHSDIIMFMFPGGLAHLTLNAILAKPGRQSIGQN